VDNQGYSTHKMFPARRIDKYTLILVIIIPSTTDFKSDKLTMENACIKNDLRNVVEAQLVVVFRGGNDAGQCVERHLQKETQIHTESNHGGCSFSRTSWSDI